MNLVPSLTAGLAVTIGVSATVIGLENSLDLLIGLVIGCIVYVAMLAAVLFDSA